MAGSLVISTLNNDTGVLATQNGMTGIAKAWVNFAGSTGTINGTAFNVSSVTRASTGSYTVNFTTTLPNANYSIVGGIGATGGDYGSDLIFSSLTTTSVAVGATNRTPAFTDFANTCVVVFSS
jgi:hypothetical protein